MVKEGQFTVHFESFVLGLGAIFIFYLTILLWLWYLKRFHFFSIKVHRIFQSIFIFLWVGIFSLFGFSLIYYRDEKIPDVTDLTSLVQQVKQQQEWSNSNQLDEGLVTFVLACTLLFIGAAWCAHDLLKQQHFTIISSIIYILGWIFMGTVASLNGPSYLSIDNTKMLICFPSLLVAVLSSFWIPFEPSYGVSFSTLGFFLFTLGHSIATI
jgi:hypothetical protein